MKKIFSLLILFVCAFSLYAQKDVTTFLGIPVDGSYANMKRQIVAKGFKPMGTGENEYLKGTFNGKDVSVYIVTNRDKVCRIMVSENGRCSESQIKINFNRLVKEFENSGRYIAASFESQEILDSEDIDYEMLVHSKSYDAAFMQAPDPTKIDTLAVQAQIREEMLKKFTPEQIEADSEEVQKELQNASMMIALEIMGKKSVWFRIFKEEYGSNFYINYFYDNEYNRSHGEDL